MFFALVDKDDSGGLDMEEMIEVLELVSSMVRVWLTCAPEAWAEMLAHDAEAEQALPARHQPSMCPR